MNKIAVLLLTLLLFSGVVNGQWVLNNGNYLQSVGTNKIGIGVLPGIYPGKVNIAAQSTEPHIWLFGGPSVSASNLSSKFNINSSSSANLGLITTNSIGGGGLGILEGPYIVSPVVWMYNSTTGNNAFTVGRMNYSASGVSDFENNFMPLLQVRENGNVGIGVTNPRASLDVGNDISGATLGTVLGRMPEGNASGEGTFLGVRGYGTQNSSYSGKSFALEHSFYGQVNSSINFYRGFDTTGGYLTCNTNANTEQMRITYTGNVGIGTPSPGSFKLAVNGKIWGKEVQVAVNNPGPDYVFEKDYALPSLNDVKAYIDQNKHLPEVPSAKEMEANGINLSEMNMLLLKKVEELTLYVIDQQKQINELKNNK